MFIIELGDPLLSRLPNWLRWIIVVPLSLGVGFVTAGLVAFVAGGKADPSSGLPAYSAVFVSGLVYIWAALMAAYTLAPSRKRMVAAVLGFLILGDLSFVHLVLRGDVFEATTVAQLEEGLELILGLLRADDFSELQRGGITRVVGALVGLFCAGWNVSRLRSGK